MPKNEKTTDAMKVCASFVRLCKCPKCLHFQTCQMRGEPQPTLGKFIASLVLFRVPNVQKLISEAVHDEVTIKVLHNTTHGDTTANALVYLSITSKFYQARKRIALEDYGDSLTFKALVAYAMIARKYSKRKEYKK